MMQELIDIKKVDDWATELVNSALTDLNLEAEMPYTLKMVMVGMLAETYRIAYWHGFSEFAKLQSKYLLDTVEKTGKEMKNRAKKA